MTWPALISLPITTPEGVFVASYSECGLGALDFPGTKSATASQAPPGRQIQRWHQLASRAVVAVLAGKPVTAWPPLDLRSGTEFQRAVWEILSGIPAGQTLSYGEVAQKLGKPGAARAVGAACGANPVPVLVPCHRVLASGGQLGGFTAGLAWKRKLLAREGVCLAVNA